MPSSSSSAAGRKRPTPLWPADLGPKARAVKGSVSDLVDLDRLYSAVKTERGSPDIVFANAGAGSPLALGKITAEHVDEIFDTSVKGSIFMVQKALPLMREGGSIILTGSSAKLPWRTIDGGAEIQHPIAGWRFNPRQLCLLP